MSAQKLMTTGAFVLGGFLLFALGLFLIGDRRMLFSHSGNYFTEFAGVSGLEVGDKVRVAGLDAGEILDLHIPSGPGEKFRVKFRVVEKLFPVIRQDSVASIQTDGLLGNKYLLISTGTTGQAPQESLLQSREPFEMGDLMARVGDTVKSINETFGEVKGNITEASTSVVGTAHRLNDIIAGSQDDIRKTTAAINQITADTSVITGRLNAGQGTVGKLLKDDALYNHLTDASQHGDEILANLRVTSDHVRELVVQFQSGRIPENLEATVANVESVTERLKVMIASLQPGLSSGEGLTADLRATMSSSREAMSDLAQNMEALKHSFFFRGFFNNRGFFDLDTLSLADYQSKAFEKKARKEREWVESSGLFAVQPDGSEQLSDAGRGRVDNAMEEFHRYTEGIALIVEGYSGYGTPGERFMRARNRSAVVRDYVEMKFALGPQYVGVMPMNAAPSHINPAINEDGIALVLLRKQ